MDMKNCEACCPHCEKPQSQKTPSLQISSEDSCCVFYQSQSLSALSIDFQKNEDFSQFQIYFTPLIFLSSLQADLLASSYPFRIPYHSSPPASSLFLSKQSFLV